MHPIPASSILAAHLAISQRDRKEGRDAYLKTGVAEVDEYVLLGGIRRGAVVGVSGGVGEGGGSGKGKGGGGGGRGRGIVEGGNEDGEGEGEGGRLISLHLLATTLLASYDVRAAIIDTTGTFPIRLLADVLRSRLQEADRQELLRRALEGNREERDLKETFEVRIKELLERVDVTRVFDVDGLREVLDEVVKQNKDLSCKAIYEQMEHMDKVIGLMPPSGRGKSQDIWKTTQETDAVPEKQVSRLETSKAAEIMDSEADDESDDMEPNVPIAQKRKYPSAKKKLDVKGLFEAFGKAKTSGDGTSDRYVSRWNQKTELVVVDNMTVLINELLARVERIAAHAQLSSMSRHLTSLTRPSTTPPTPPGDSPSSCCLTQPLTVLLLNTLTPNTATPIKNPNRQTSIFESTASRFHPSLGVILSQFLDLHLLVHRLPLRRRDAEILYAGEFRGGGGGGGWHERALGNEEVKMANVLEVLRDDAVDVGRWEDERRDAEGMPEKRRNREQRWCAFVVEDGLRIRGVTLENPR